MVGLSATASATMDMSLEDIISANNANRRGGMARGRAQGKVRGIVRRSAIRAFSQPGPFGRGGGRGGPLNFRGGFRPRGGPIGIGGGATRPPLLHISTQSLRANANFPNAFSAMPSGPAKLLISNLDPGVSDTDIQELFMEFGTVTNASVHYDRMGKSLSSGQVEFTRYVDAVKAQKQYNEVNLDGRPMKIIIEAEGVGARGDGRGGMRGLGQRVNMPLKMGFAGNQMGFAGNQMGFGGNQMAAVKRLQQPPRMMGSGNRGRGGLQGMRGAGRIVFPVNNGGFNNSYSMRGSGPVNRGAFRGNFMRGGRGGTSTFRGRGTVTGMRGGFGNTRGARGGGRGKWPVKKTPTAEELDAELDVYLNEHASS